MKNRNVCRWITRFIVLGGIMLAGISIMIFDVPTQPLFVVGAVTSFGGLIFGVITVRCPFCGSLLDLHGFWTEYCPYCGKKLE